VPNNVGAGVRRCQNKDRLYHVTLTIIPTGTALFNVSFARGRGGVAVKSRRTNGLAEVRPDELAGDSPARVTKEQLDQLSNLNQFISSFYIVAEWASIVIAVVICQQLWNPFLYVAAVVIIGARQHALLILMHEGTHYRLFRNRALNDWVTEILLSWPLLVSMRSYRRNHFAHHRYLNSERDPDWVRKIDNPTWLFPKRWTELIQLLAGEISGFGAVYNIRLAFMLASTDTDVARAYKRTRLVFYVTVTVAIIWLGGGKIFLLYWLLPFLTWLMLVLRVRSIAEHFAIAGGRGIYSEVRTTRAGILGRLFIAPLNINLHTEHHVFPSVPFYRLPKLQRLLMSNPGFRSAVHLSYGYWGVLRECSDVGATPANPLGRTA
jgi:fatty acid desaturase